MASKKTVGDKSSDSHGQGHRDLKTLVIVESPAKARKIGGYLGDGYIV